MMEFIELGAVWSIVSVVLVLFFLMGLVDADKDNQ